MNTQTHKRFILDPKSCPDSIQAAAKLLYQSFDQTLTTRHRVWLRTDAPMWMQQVVQQAQVETTHGDSLMITLKRCAAALADSTAGEETDAISDTPVYTIVPMMIEWLRDVENNAFYINQAFNDADNFESLDALVQAAHRQQIDEIGISLIEILRVAVDDFAATKAESPLVLDDLQMEMLGFCNREDGLDGWYYRHLKPEAKKALDTLMEMGLVTRDLTISDAFITTPMAAPYIARYAGK